jgi:transposase
MSIVKQSVGIDISKSTFTACVCHRSTDGSVKFSKVHSFGNESKGFNQFLRWVKSESTAQNAELVFLMEATGVYYESLAYHLHKIKKVVHVVLANTSKHYFSSLNIKSKTDKIDARVLSQFGAERRHRVWCPPSPVFLQLRNLTRYHLQLQEQKTAIGNLRHSKEAAYDVQTLIIKSNKRLIAEINKQIQICLAAIDKLIKSDEGLKEKVRKLNTIKGVGLITIATILAETSGFAGFNNAKQLVRYAGYDIVQNESGSSVKGKTRISKKGNRYIRNALYFPAMVSCRCNPAMKIAYVRIIQKKSSKMIGQVAIQRKLLVLIYSMWKNETEFMDGFKTSSPSLKAETTQDSAINELP